MLYYSTIYEGIELTLTFSDHDEFIEFRNAAKDCLLAIRDKNVDTNSSRPTKTIVVHKGSRLNGRMIRPIFIHHEELNENENLTLNSILRIYMEDF